MSLTVVILTKNHELTVAKAICSIKESFPDATLLVADSFSKDNTVRVAEAFGTQVIIVQNLGEALKKAKETQDEGYLLVTPSFSFNKDDLVTMTDGVVAHSADLVLGVTQQKQTLATKLFNRKFSSTCIDPGSPLRAFNKKLFDFLTLTDKLSFVDMTAAALQNHLAVRECMIRSAH